MAFRLARADECAFEIGQLISKWSASGPVDLVQERTGKHIVSRVDRVRPVPPAVALLFSEAINHLRAALDNVVWFLVESEIGSVPDAAEPLVALPISEDEMRFSKWSKRRVKNGLLMFGEGHRLYRLLVSLQPWADTNSVILSTSTRLASFTGRKNEPAHPLILLQKYSNLDKHRSIRLAVYRSMVTRFGTPILSQDLSLREVSPGAVIHEGIFGKPVEYEFNTATVIQRPSPYSAFVNPVKEINGLRKYVSEVAIPTMLIGLVNPRGLPPEIDLSDSGEDFRSRIITGSMDDAELCLQPTLLQHLVEASKVPASVPKTTHK